MVELFTGGEIYEHLSISLTRSLEGFVLALVVGIPAGLLMGYFPAASKRSPIRWVQTLRQTPVLALFPIFILVFGIGETPKVVMIFWGTVVRPGGLEVQPVPPGPANEDVRAG